MKKDTKYPANQGWIKAKLNIIPGSTISKGQAISFCTGGGKEVEYEIPEFRHHKTIVRMVFRKVKEVRAEGYTEVEQNCRGCDGPCGRCGDLCIICGGMIDADHGSVCSDCSDTHMED